MDHRSFPTALWMLKQRLTEEVMQRTAHYDLMFNRVMFEKGKREEDC